MHALLVVRKQVCFHADEAKKLSAKARLNCTQDKQRYEQHTVRQCFMHRECLRVWVCNEAMFTLIHGHLSWSFACLGELETPKAAAFELRSSTNQASNSRRSNLLLLYIIKVASHQHYLPNMVKTPSLARCLMPQSLQAACQRNTSLSHRITFRGESPFLALLYAWLGISHCVVVPTPAAPLHFLFLLLTPINTTPSTPHLHHATIIISCITSISHISSVYYNASAAYNQCLACLQ